MPDTPRGSAATGSRRWRRQLRDEETLLAAMRRGVAYGLDLSRVTRLGPGRLYSALRRLEEDGAIVGSFEDGPEPRRRFYKIAPDQERSAVPLTTSAAVCTTQQNPGRVRPAYTVTFTVEVSGPDHWQPDQVIAALTRGVRWAEGQQQMSGDHGGFARLRATEVRRG